MFFFHPWIQSRSQPDTPILTITEVPHLSRSTPSIKGAVSPWCCQRCRHDSQQIWGGTTNRVGVVKDCQNVCLALRIQILTLKAQCVCSRFGPTKNGKVHFHESYCKTLGFIYISLFFDLRSGNRKWSNYRKWPLIFNSLSTRCWGWPTSHAFGRGPGKAHAAMLSWASFLHVHPLTPQYLSWNFCGRPDVLCSSLEAEPARTTGGCLMKGVQHVLFLYHCWVPDVFFSLCCSTCIRLIWLPVLAQEGPLSVGIVADDFATAAKAEFPKWNTMENWKGYFLA